MNLLSVSLTPAGSATAILLAGLLWLPFALTSRPRPAALLWLAAPLGGLLFLGGVFWVQVPMQALIQRFVLLAVPPLTLAAWPVLIAVPLALAAGLVQEAARLAAALGALRLSRRPRGAAPWTGALAGAGVGLLEAAWLLGAIPPQHFHLLGAAVFERFWAVAFHVAAGALLGLGVAARRTAFAFVLAVLLHGAVDTFAALYGMGRVPYAEVLWAVALISSALFALTLIAVNRAGRAPGPRPDLIRPGGGDTGARLRR